MQGTTLTSVTNGPYTNRDWLDSPQIKVCVEVSTQSAAWITLVFSPSTNNNGSSGGNSTATVLPAPLVSRLQSATAGTPSPGVRRHKWDHVVSPQWDGLRPQSTRVVDCAADVEMIEDIGRHRWRAALINYTVPASWRLSTIKYRVPAFCALYIRPPHTMLIIFLIIRHFTEAEYDLRSLLCIWVADNSSKFSNISYLRIYHTCSSLSYF